VFSRFIARSPRTLVVRLFKSIAAADFLDRLISQLQHFPILLTHV
jgi:hypothetical protein